MPTYIADKEKLSYIGTVTWHCACRPRIERPPQSWVYCPQCGETIREVVSCSERAV